MWQGRVPGVSPHDTELFFLTEAGEGERRPLQGGHHPDLAQCLAEGGCEQGDSLGP